MDSYRTIAHDGAHEIELKKSRFICQLYRIENEAHAKSLIQECKKTHWKANHCCSAFICGKAPQVERSSDDGEPSGTAGIPMLDVLKKQELENVLAVVIRYFGGTKLGAGGLIRAYSHAVSEALTEIGLVEGRLQQEVRLQLQYPAWGKLAFFLETNEKYLLKETLYTDTITAVCLVNEDQATTFQNEVIELLNNQVQLEFGPTAYLELPLKKDK